MHAHALKLHKFAKRFTQATLSQLSQEEIMSITYDAVYFAAVAQAAAQETPDSDSRRGYLQAIKDITGGSPSLSPQKILSEFRATL